VKNIDFANIQQKKHYQQNISQHSTLH